MKTNHTPGPWNVISTTIPEKVEYFIFSGETFKTSLGIIKGLHNAKLISCAPELLLSLKNLVDWAAHLPQLANEDIAKAKELIKKATE